ncbi:MAG TPA: proton-conducting transporter membrane subunit, partial [Polyangiaceae bacterium]
DVQGKAPAREALLAKKGWRSIPLVTIACLLLFVGAIGKSAQFPLFVWLPDAMAGPTPVSALIHAATMVTAGIYLVARLSFLFALSGAALTVIAAVGAGTALLAAIAGLFQYDLKRILAYSTVSQLGFMVLGVGVGAYEAGVFHLITHACFKACLFLSAGAVLHALHPVEHVERKRQDVRRMGGLRRVLPKTARAYFIACLAITAAPIPGLSGFWSKDEILARAFVSSPLAFGVALLAAGLTSFYMWRSWYLTFEGEARTELKAVHEVTRPMTAVLELLAVASALAGVLGFRAGLFGGSGESLLGAWLAPALRAAPEPKAVSAAAEWAVAGAAYLLALGGWALARARYGASRAKDWDHRERRVWLYEPSAHAFWLDAIYGRILVPLTSWAAGFLAEFDQRVIDGLVNAAAGVTRAVGWVVGRTDDGVVDGAVRGLSNATLAAGEKLRAAQTGRIQTYVYAISLGVLAISFLQYWLR